MIRDFLKRSLTLTASAYILLVSGLAPVYAQTPEYKQAFEAYQKQDFATAETLWTDIAERGDVNAQYALGVMNLRDESSDASDEDAYRWFKMAAEQGHATAMFNVGVAYWEGTGTEIDRQTALGWWEKAARQGESGAQFNLGLAYYIGEEREADLETAAKWIGLAADQNHPEAKRIMQVIAEENPQLAAANTRKQLVKDEDIGTSKTADVKTTSQDIQTPATEKSDDQTTTTAESDTAATAGATDVSTSQTTGSTQTQATAATTEEPAGSTYWKTVALNTPLYVKPSASSIIFSSLPNGTPIEIIDRRPGWLRVTLPAGLKTWIFSKFLDVNGNRGRVNGTSVRARPQPSTDNTNSPPIGAYNRGDDVAVLEKSGQWIRIRAPKHIGAWIRTDDAEQYEDTESGRDELWKLMVSKGL
ncbi:MAG: SH3 domain-containing protein [Pseudomonadota bacterium]